MADIGECEHGTPQGDLGGCRLCKNAAIGKHVHDTLSGFLDKHPEHFTTWLEAQHPQSDCADRWVCCLHPMTEEERRNA